MFHKKKNKNKEFSKAVVIFILLINTIFTAAVFYVFLRVGNEPTALIGAWFGFTTVELWSLSKIKREDIKNDSNGNFNGGFNDSRSSNDWDNNSFG